MESGRKLVAVVVILVVLGGAKAVSFCNMTEEGLEACRPSVTQPNPVEPSSECCDALSNADLKCLCSYRNSIVLPSLGIDPDLALGLPVKCNLNPPAEC
ncbi:putative lipid-transfer protein DIR1 [Olea europaea var. sylvestris]|uniref:Bifunctional inhibitor/plant lipid transfer protein/seed storage helical domain-containing protein n=1 Tax=Olea europaea subsp. europaea TaxID=158383 RepID=A0A8S0T8P4_OLEEU|nr:putative lipid-transfer protein DIR1 [Olea europaea var. sylvestris]CAA3001428.1 Hypothetical predicted protein [Olea europaea subsp. europaea]